MNTRPIIFNGAMIRALLDGTKTQTRRIVKPQKHPYGYSLSPDRVAAEVIGQTCAVRCPYGQPGDLLWVREALHATSNDQGLLWMTYSADGKDVFPLTQWPSSRYIIASRFMPRWASRITLLLTDVRVERVQDIEPADCLAEGLPAGMWDDPPIRDRFRDLWNTIHGPDAWERNDWVWALTFKHIMANVDAVLANPTAHGLKEAQ